MIYLENFINEIKYFKNIVNFKSEYFKKRNSEEINKNEKLIEFYNDDLGSNNKTKTKYNFINTEKMENLVQKSNKTVKRQNEENQNVNDLISNFDILKEIKELKNNSTEKKSKLQSENDLLDQANKDLDAPSSKDVTTPSDNNDNFWTKLSEQKHQENLCNKKIKEFDILKELFYMNVKLEKEKHNSFDSKDKINLKEILKLLTLSDNKKIFQDVFSTQNYDEKKTHYFSNQTYQGNNIQAYHTRNDPRKFINNNTDLSVYSEFNINYIDSNPDFPYHPKINPNPYPNQNMYYNSFDYEAHYNQNNNIEKKHTSMSFGISISNDNYIKIRNMIDNFKNLFIKYKFRSAYESYLIEHNKNLELLNFIENEDLENVSDKRLLDVIGDKNKKEVQSMKSKENNNNNNNENTKKKTEVENNKTSNNSGHISDYLSNHPLYTNFTDNFKDTIDYIFYSKYLIVDKILKLPYLNELVSEGFLPSSKYPSDHLPLYAEFYTN